MVLPGVNDSAELHLASEAALGQRTLRKAGWRLIPLLSICYMVAYMDRANISFAALQMNRDLHFNAASTASVLVSSLSATRYASCPQTSCC